MSTLEQRELAGAALINQPALPTESKHTLDEAHRKAHEMALCRRDIRELDNYQIMEYKQDLTDTLGNPYDKVKNQLNQGNYKIITNEEAMHVPYRRAS